MPVLEAHKSLMGHMSSPEALMSFLLLNFYIIL